MADVLDSAAVVLLGKESREQQGLSKCLSLWRRLVLITMCASTR